jgi:hypothetical protein
MVPSSGVFQAVVFMLPFGSCVIEPNGRNSPVQPSFGVTIFVYVSCLFGVDEL